MPVSKPEPELRVVHVRGHAIMLDSDLAALYGVSTMAFNQAVRRNAHRFPSDFAFPLSREEFGHLISQNVISSGGHGGRRKLPWVFTEHGAIMAAMILKSDRAVAMSTYVVRAFVQMRRELLTNATLEARLMKIEKTLLVHDVSLRKLFGRIKPLLLPLSDIPEKEMGYHTTLKKA